MNGKKRQRDVLLYGSLTIHLASLGGAFLRPDPGASHLLWLLSLVGILVALHTPLSREKRPSKKRILLPCILLTIIALSAAFLRIYRIHTLPPGLWVDELYTASNALELSAGSAWKNPFHMTPLVGEGWVETSNLYLYFVRLIWLFFGLNYLGMKMVSILPGIAAVLFLYRFGKSFWGVNVALAGAFLLGISSWQISLSRWGWDEVLLTALQIPAFYYLFRGVKTRRSFDWALSGLLFALCLYTYAASRIIALFAFCFLGLEFAKSAPFRKKYGKNLPAFLLLFFLTLLPLGLWMVRHPAEQGARFREISILREVKAGGSFIPLFRNIAGHALMFHARGDPNPRHHVASLPLLDPVSGVFLAVGVLTALFGIRERKNRFLLLWLCFGLVGGILSSSSESPQSYRTGVAAPPVFLLCGVGAMWVARRARRLIHTPEKRKTAASWILVPLFIIALLLNAQRYFVLYSIGDLNANPPRTLVEEFWGSEHSSLARHVKSGGDNVLLDAAFRSDYYFLYRTAMRIIAGRVPGYFDPVKRQPSPPPGGFELIVPRFREIHYNRFLPSVKMSRLSFGSNALDGEDPDFLKAWINPDTLSRSPAVTEQEKKHPFEIYYYGEHELIREERRDNLEIGTMPDGTTRVIAKSQFIVPEDSRILLKLQSGSPAELFIDGSRVALNERGESYSPLKKGIHEFQIEVSGKGDLEPFRMLWRPDLEHTELIPPEFFLSPGFEKQTR